jgi:hypothetical protein
MSSIIDTATPVDDAAIPLPVGIALFVIPLLWGCHMWLRLRPKLSDGVEQVFHGVYMALVAYPMGILIPHAKIKKVMGLAHGVALIQAALLITMGGAWHTTFGFEDKSRASVMAKWINLYGFWINTFGMMWGAATGAKDLFYVTKEFVNYQAPPHIEAVLHILLKSQGLCNVISTVLIMKQMASKYETNIKDDKKNA